MIFQSIKASQRNRLTNSLFSSTFAVCFALVGANSLLPCPVDSSYGNDSIIEKRLQEEQKKSNV